MTAPTQDLDKLFPLPSLPPSKLSPSAPLGVTHESAEALVRLLKENHVKHHCFHNDQGFHNHLSHHLYAAYYLGANPTLLQAVYDSGAHEQRPSYKSPSAINIENWKDHLGNEDFYDSYLAFFSAELLTKGLEPTLEKFLFSTEANWGIGEQDKHPEMLSRLLGGTVHPFIFVGYGVEFGQLGMVAEGLAQTAVHSDPISGIITRDFLAHPFPAASLSASLANKSNLDSEPSQPIHPFTVLARIQKGPRLPPTRDTDLLIRFQETLKSHGNLIREYADAWDADTSSPEAVESRVEEIVWVVTLIYGVGGYRKDKPFKADFFILHLLNASLFIPSLLHHLSANSQRMLLRSFFAVSLGYWVSQGRTELDPETFYKLTTSNPDVPGLKPTPQAKSLETAAPDTWYPILQLAMTRPGEHSLKVHLLKLERALVHYASLYDKTPKGYFKGTELAGAEKLDGSIFLRVAWLSFNRSEAREGEEPDFWEFDGFFHE